MIAFADELYEGQFVRTLGHAVYGGADIGEMVATAGRIRRSDRESWLAEWRALADRRLASAHASREAGDAAGARAAFLRASNYYRNAYVLHLEAPLPQAVRECYRAQQDAFAQAEVGTPFEVPWRRGRCPPGSSAAARDGVRWCSAWAATTGRPRSRISGTARPPWPAAVTA